MTPEERSELLDALAELAYQDAETLDPLTTFLPLDAHRRALGNHVVVVLGGRGAGKTALFRLMNDPKSALRLGGLLQMDPVPDAAWIDAFSPASHHPETGTLEQYAQGNDDIALRAFWMAHLLRRVHEEAPGVVQLAANLQAILSAPAADIAAWMPVAVANLGAVNAALDAADRSLQAAQRGLVAAYDNLDRLGQFDPGIRRRYISTLLSLWLSLASRYRALHGKIFLRDDLFDAGELGFADATKLRPRSARIEWEDEALFQVVVRHLANGSPAMRGWLQTIPELALQDRGEFGFMPGPMPPPAQVALAGRIAGKIIGKGVLKSYTSRWVLGRLRDAAGRITPRSMLWFWGFAAVEARSHPPVRKTALVSSADLVVALRRASDERVNEIREEYDLVARIENLQGMTIPLERSEVVRKLGEPRKNEPKGLPAQGQIILDELLRLGILRTDDGGNIDVPDIYRYKFEITPDYATAWKEFLTGDDRAARKHFPRELPILGEILRRVGGEDRWSEIGKDELEGGDYANARAKCENALALAQNAKDREGESELLIRLGRISFAQKNYLRAREEFQRAANIWKRTGKAAREAGARWFGGLTYYAEGNLEEAEQKFSEALTMAERSRAQAWEALCHDLLGKIDIAQNHTDAAAEHFKRALSVAQERNNGDLETMAFESIADLAEKLNSNSTLLLKRINAFVAEQKKTFSLTRLSSKYDEFAAQLHLSPEQREAVCREAKAAYARDQGWGIVRATFPDPDPPVS